MVFRYFHQAVRSVWRPRVGRAKFRNHTKNNYVERVINMNKESNLRKILSNDIAAAKVRYEAKQQKKRNQTGVLRLLYSISILATVGILILNNHYLTIENNFLISKSQEFNPAPTMQPTPVSFSPYYIVKPEDNCPALDVVELGGIRSCQKSI